MRRIKIFLPVFLVIALACGLGWYLFWQAVPAVDLDALLLRADLETAAGDEAFPWEAEHGSSWGEETDGGRGEEQGPGGVPPAGEPAGGSVSGERGSRPHVPPSAVTVAGLREKYHRQALRMEQRYEGALNYLLLMGMEEYARHKSGELKTSVSVLAAKYLKAGQALEARCDAEFDVLLRRLETELKAYGLPTAMVREARVEYRARKDERRRELLDLARNHLDRI
ncbi:MAG: hypothetical protein IBX71_10670 [Candidatus Desulforudis sp.]|nr:hypothetical protein [Desulforudis sp.]